MLISLLKSQLNYYYHGFLQTQYNKGCNFTLAKLHNQCQHYQSMIITIINIIVTFIITVSSSLSVLLSLSLCHNHLFIYLFIN